VRILLDECIDRRLAKEIDGHEVVTVPQAGWAGIKNGELLALAQQQFDVLVTVDRNLSFQQNLPQFNIAVVILQAPTNRLNDLRRLVPKLHGLLQGLVKGQFRLLNLEIRNEIKRPGPAQTPTFFFPPNSPSTYPRQYREKTPHSVNEKSWPFRLGRRCLVGVKMACYSLTWLN
jgi:hypothetical protein